MMPSLQGDSDDRGTCTAAQRAITCHGWVGAKGLLPGHCRFCQDLGCVSHQQPTSQAGWEENFLLVSRPSTFDLEKSKGCCQLPRKSFAWSRCDSRPGVSFLQEPTSLNAQLGGHRG